MQHRKTSNTDNSGVLDSDGPGPLAGPGQTRGIICLSDVSVLEFESLLTFFYER
jgi:hypothetical protein